jgi:hypothetical protein
MDNMEHKQHKRTVNKAHLTTLNLNNFKNVQGMR